MKKLIAAMLVAVMLTLVACQTTQRDMSTPQENAAEKPVSSSSRQGETIQPVTVEEMLLHDYVRIYEKYCQGTPFSSPAELDASIYQAYLFGWLRENSDLEPFAVYDGGQISYYSVPPEDSLSLLRLYFGGQLQPPAREKELEAYFQELTYDPFFEENFLKNDLDVRVEAYEQLENGNHRLTVRRFSGENEWLPAVYEFETALVENDPGALLNGSVKAGDVRYRFVSMQHLPLESPVAGNIVEISKPQDLYDLAKLVNSGDWVYQSNIYEMTADLDMSGISMEPIGSYVGEDFRDPASSGFNASFDGRGYTIKNLTIENHSGMTGLFAHVGKNGMVSNLDLVDCKLSSSNKGYPQESYPTGGVAGLVEGMLSKCSFSGKVSGTGSVGGLVGATGGANIQNCRVNAVVTGNNAVGGLIGATSMSAIYSCTVTGEVNAVGIAGQTPREIGGYIGTNNNTPIDHGIASVMVKTYTTSEWVGCFMGYNYGDLITCFYDTDVAGQWKTIDAPYQGADYTVDLIGLTHQQLSDMGAF